MFPAPEGKEPKTLSREGYLQFLHHLSKVIYEETTPEVAINTAAEKVNDTLCYFRSSAM